MAYGGIDVVGPCAFGVTPTILDQVEGSLLNLQPRSFTKSTDGQVDPTYSAYESFAPMFRGTTDKIAAFLTLAGISASIPAAPGFVQYFQAVDLTTGLRKSGANHASATFATCLVVPRTLTVNHGEQGAKISFDVIGYNASGLTNPVVLASGATLPALAGVSQLYTMGPIKIGGTLYEGMQSYSIDFGLKIAIKMGTGVSYPQLVYIEDRRPKITIKTNDASLLSALTLLGTPISGGATKLFLRSFSQSGLRTADGSAAHISFTMTLGNAYVTEKAATHPGEFQTGIVLEPIWDQSNAILNINTATIIS